MEVKMQQQLFVSMPDPPATPPTSTPSPTHPRDHPPARYLRVKLMNSFRLASPRWVLSDCMVGGSRAAASAAAGPQR